MNKQRFLSILLAPWYWGFWHFGIGDFGTFSRVPCTFGFARLKTLRLILLNESAML
jgi:hypothetical protein